MLWRRVLRAIADMPGRGPGEYAKALGVSSGSMGRAIDRLEAKRFITRRPVPDQGHKVALNLTDEGRKALDELPR